MSGRACVCAAAALALCSAVPALAQGADATPPATDRAAAYAELSERATGVALSADELRALGRDELDRIAQGVRSVMDEVGFDGSVADFYAFLRTDDRFYFPDTEAGRAAYLAEVRRIVEEVQGRLDEVIEPPAGMAAVRVAAVPVAPNWVGMAVYSAARPDDALASATLGFNLTDMRSAPTYFLPSIAVHEGVLGHHLQVEYARARARAGQTLSERNGAGAMAFVEGWAFYAEGLLTELGLYQDPYDKAGQLGMQAWRAARLVADVGLYIDGWTRQDAVAFMLANTPLSERQIGLEVDRCLESPASTSVYIVGRREILRQRAKAQAALGDRFDLRAFHAHVLGDGVVTPSALEETINAWIAEERAD